MLRLTTLALLLGGGAGYALEHFTRIRPIHGSSALSPPALGKVAPLSVYRAQSDRPQLRG